MTRDQLLSKANREARARKYLRSKEQPTRGNIRAGLSFLILVIATVIIMMAL